MKIVLFYIASFIFISDCKQEENLAKGKATYQSSTFANAISSRAVDGNTNSNYGGGSCTHTRNSKSFWYVDLGNAHLIGKVIIYNRMDCCSNRLRNTEIYVYPRKPTSWHMKRQFLCGKITKSTVNRKNVVFQCGGHQGRFVAIRKTDKEALTLCEVEVFKHEIPLPMVLDISSTLIVETETSSITKALSITCRSRDNDDDLNVTKLKFDMKGVNVYISWKRDTNYVGVWKTGDAAWKRVYSFPFKKLGVTIPRLPSPNHPLSVSLYVNPRLNGRNVTCLGKSEANKSKKGSDRKQIQVVWRPSVRSLSVTDSDGGDRIVANEAARIVCELQTGNPSRSAQIEATFGGNTLGNSRQNPLPIDKEGYEWRTLTWNRTFGRCDNGKNLTCGFGNGIRISTKVIVQYGPSPIKWNIAEGKQLFTNDRISCSSDSNPPPTIAIRLNGTEIKSQGKSILSIRIPMNMTAGRHIVECTALNGISTQRKRANITISNGETPQRKKLITEHKPRETDLMKAIFQIERNRKADEVINRKFLVKMHNDSMGVLTGIKKALKSFISVLHDKKAVNA